TWLTGIPRRARGCPAVHPWRVPCRRVSGDGMRVEPSLMHPEGGSWTRVRTHTPSKFSKVLHEPLAPIPLERSKFRDNGSQLSPNRTCEFPCIRLSIRKPVAGLWPCVYPVVPVRETVKMSGLASPAFARVFCFWAIIVWLIRPHSGLVRIDQHCS